MTPALLIKFGFEVLRCPRCQIIVVGCTADKEPRAGRKCRRARPRKVDPAGFDKPSRSPQGQLKRARQFTPPAGFSLPSIKCNPDPARLSPDDVTLVIAVLRVDN